MSLIDWAADKVQTVTGEKERKNLVERIKDTYQVFQQSVVNKVCLINSIINEFNEVIRHLNHFRKSRVECTIVSLNQFLGKFGTVKEIGAYAPEKECPPAELPVHEFEKVENYIREIDWSRSDVFTSTFWLTPIGMTIKTKKQNLSLQEQLTELRLMSDQTLKELDIREWGHREEIQIAILYKNCIEFIISTIDAKILPELRLVESFFEAMEVKDAILANQPMGGLSSTPDIALLQDTMYHKHYQFVKNTFMFYVISCKIYNTPVLTRLIKQALAPGDKALLAKQKELLLQQGQEVEKSMFIPS